MIVKGILPVSFCDIYSMSKVLFCHFGLHSSEGKRMRDSERETERESKHEEQRWHVITDPPGRL